MAYKIEIESCIAKVVPGICEYMGSVSIHAAQWIAQRYIITWTKSFA